MSLLSFKYVSFHNFFIFNLLLQILLRHILLPTPYIVEQTSPISKGNFFGPKSMLLSSISCKHTSKDPIPSLVILIHGVCQPIVLLISTSISSVNPFECLYLPCSSSPLSFFAAYSIIPTPPLARSCSTAHSSSSRMHAIMHASRAPCCTPVVPSCGP